MRNSGIELLRIVCCFLVIGIHSIPAPSTFASVGSDYGIFASELVNSIVRPGLPVFFMISGYFLLNANQLKLKNHYIKRISSILVPFIIFGILHVCITKKALDYESIIYFFTQSIKGTTAVDIHFWYVYSIIGLYVIAPLIRKSIINLSEKEAFIGYMSLLVISMYNMYFKEVYKIDDNIRYLFPLPDIGMGAFLFVSGGLINKIKNKITLLKSILLWFIGVFISVIMYKFSFNDLKFNTFPDSGIGVIITASAMLFIFVKFSFKSSLIDFIAKNTYGAFLIHLSLLRIIREYMPFTVFQYPITYTVIISFVTLAISIIVSIVVNYIIVNRIESAIIKMAL